MGVTISSVMPTVAVEDLDRAVGFYRDTLGFTVRRFDGDAATALVDVGPSGALLLYRSGFRRGETTACALLAEDVEETVQELRRRGVRFEEYDLPGLKTIDGVATMESGVKTGWFKDSEGNILAVSSEIPESVRKAA
jgi:catechol 2,3-dioxygenase-like lactoylglutathione lyase family enzyme